MYVFFKFKFKTYKRTDKNMVYAFYRTLKDLDKKTFFFLILN